jgi:predicted phosphodiesterase
MRDEIFDYVKSIDRNQVSWAETAKLVNAKFKTNYSKEALRSLYRRRVKPITTTDSAVGAFSSLNYAVQAFSNAFSGISPVVPEKAATEKKIPPTGMGRIFPDPITLPTKTTLVLSDLHVPFWDHAYLDYALTQAKEQEATQIAILGDVFDFDAISQWPQDHKTFTVESELASAGLLLRYLADRYPLYICSGNHDERVGKKLNSPMTLRRIIAAALDGVTTAHKITVTDYDYMFYPGFVLGHLSNYSKVPGKIAAEIAAKYQRHAIVGHDHIHGADWSGTHFGISIGCMADTKAFWYKERRLQTMPDFVNGFAIINQSGWIKVYRDKTHRDLFATQYS